MIEVETQSDSWTKKQENGMVKNCLYQLTWDESDMLMSDDEWFTDNSLLASQNILKEQSSISGFQDTILGGIFCHEGEHYTP